MNNIIIFSDWIVPEHTWMKKIKSSAVILFPSGIIAETSCPELDGFTFRKSFAHHSILDLLSEPVNLINGRRLFFVHNVWTLLKINFAISNRP